MYIESIQIDHLKAFQSVRFHLKRADGMYAGWTVFVGGNASGKSTLLKAIALALMGPEAGRQLIGMPTGWMRQQTNKASITLKIITDLEYDQFLRKGKKPKDFRLGVEWHRSSAEQIPQFMAIKEKEDKLSESGPWNLNAKGWFFTGYGPMRRLSGSSSESIRYSLGGGVVSRNVTLFREDAALSESEEWLRKVYSRALEEEQTDWKDLLSGVQSLLNDGLLPHGMHISRVTVDQVFVKDERGLELPMREISDGCRGVYATVLDIIHGMAEVYGSDNLFAKTEEGTPIVDRPGIVLIDEVEAHLHPAWQQEIPYWLTKHFPKIQFLITTHSPLIAQAADQIFLLPLQGEIDRQPRALTEEEVNRIRLGSAHKTVLGVAFGLKSIRSRWANQQIKRWQILDAKKRAGVPLSTTEIKEHRELFGLFAEIETFDTELDLMANHENTAKTNGTTQTNGTKTKRKNEIDS